MSLGHRYGAKLTIGVQDVIDFLKRQALGALGEIDNEGDWLDGAEASWRSRGRRILGHGEGAILGVLELDLKDAVLLSSRHIRQCASL